MHYIRFEKSKKVSFHALKDENTTYCGISLEGKSFTIETPDEELICKNCLKKIPTYSIEVKTIQNKPHYVVRVGDEEYFSSKKKKVIKFLMKRGFYLSKKDIPDV